MMLSRALLLFALLCHTSSAVILERNSHESKEEISSGEKPPPESHESKEEISSEEKPPPESHESKEEISSEEQPPPESHKATKDVSSEEEPLLDSHESKEEISRAGSNQESSELAQEEEDKMQINSTVVLPGDDDRKRRPTVPTSTPIPNCPTYVSCPWVYPQPITTESSDQENDHPKPVGEGASEMSPGSSLTENESNSGDKDGSTNKQEAVLEEHIGGQENESGSHDKDSSTPPGNRPSISATQKPQYPSFVPGPWIYPKPIVEGVSETTSTEKPAKQEEERPIEQHFGVQRNESDSTGTIVSSSQNIPAPQGMNEDNEKRGTNDPGHRPTVPTSTPIPNCPSYVSCPWVYPQPITTESSDQENDHPKPASEISPGSSLTENESNSGDKDGSTNKQEELLEEHIGGQENESGSGDKEGSTPSGNRPSISATQKPQYPSFVPGPWIYPQPVGELAPEITSTNKPEEVLLEEHIGGQENESGSSDKGSSTTTTFANRPSISATQKPQYPSFVPGPWIYPQPVGELAPEITSTNKPEEVLLEEHIGGQKNESGSSDKEGSTTTGTRPSISATHEPQYPSYVPGPWIYPQPVGELAPEITSTNKPEEVLEEHIGGQENESGSGDKDGSTPSGNRPSISATQKPQYPPYVPGPWIYPKPIVELAPEITSTNKPEEVLLEEHIGGQENESGSSDKEGSTTSTSGNRPSISATQKPQYPSYVPGPWIYPQPIGEGVYQISTTKKPGNPLLSEHFGLLENESGSGNKVGSSASSSKPQAPPTNIPLAGTAGSSEQMVFPGPTTRYPPKKPAKRPSLLSSLWNPEKNVMAADRFAAGIDFEDDLTDIIETYASNFFYYSPILSKRKDSPSETNKRLQAAYKPPALLVDKAYPSAGVYFLSVPMELKA